VTVPQAALAFLMAVRSRDLREKDVRSLRGAFLRHVLRHPLDLVWPVRRSREAG